MKTPPNLHGFVLFLAAACSVALPAYADLFPVSVPLPTASPPAGGNGDSSSAMLSADGRCVLFASSAENLVALTNPGPASALSPRCLNVFLRDRTAGTTVLVSLNAAGTSGGNGNSFPAGLSTNNQFALFESAAGNLVAGDTNSATDIFRRDLLSGTTTLVSAGLGGASARGGASRNAVMTPDARFVAFVSAATNLLADDTNGIADVFVRDLNIGTTTLVSVGAQATNSSGLGCLSDYPVITPDGRYVAFYSTASNLVAGVPKGAEIYVRDLFAGTTTWASTNARAIYVSLFWGPYFGWTNLVSCNHVMSDDGQFVAFEVRTNLLGTMTMQGNRYASGLILRHNLQTGITDIVHTNANAPFPGSEEVRNLDMTPDGRFIVFVANTNAPGNATFVCRWDAQTGTNQVVSGNRTGTAINPGTFCDWPRLDPSGRYIAFLCSDTNLTGNPLAGEFHLYVRDMLSTNRLVDITTNATGAGVSPAMVPALSVDGRVVAFHCPDAGFVTNDWNRAEDVFVRDMLSNRTELISVRHPALAASARAGSSGFGPLTISGDGTLIAFTSEANLVANDTNRCRDVFVRDVLAGTNILVSVASNGAAANGMSFEPGISANGRHVVFTSWASNLVPGDNYKELDVFVRDLVTRSNILVSTFTDDCHSPIISSDGKYVLFRRAGLGSTQYLYLRDLEAGTNWSLTSAGVAYAAMTPDGRYVAYIDYDKLYLWDTEAATKTLLSSTATYPKAISISPDGNRIAWFAGLSPVYLYALDRAANTNWTIGTLYPASPRQLPFSVDSRFLAYAAAISSGSTNHVYLYDFEQSTNRLISRNFSSSGLAASSCDSPALSPNGRFVAYRTWASNSVPNDFNDVPDLVVCDRLFDATFLVSLSNSDDRTANQRSAGAVFSVDNQTLVFLSWASDLVSEDFDHNADVFALPLNPDADADGMDDQWEMDSFATLARDGAGDWDNDGTTDLFEYRAGTDPTDPASVFTAGIVPPPTNDIGPTVFWPAAAWKTYRVQYKDELGAADWQDLPAGMRWFGASGFMTDLAPAVSNRFYRILVNY